MSESQSHKKRKVEDVCEGRESKGYVAAHVCAKMWRPWWFHIYLGNIPISLVIHQEVPENNTYMFP